MNWVILSWPSGETPRLSKGKKVVERSIENFVPMIAVIKNKKLYHPLNSRPPKDTLSEKKKLRTPCLICWSHQRKDEKKTMYLLELQMLAVISSVFFEKTLLEDKSLLVFVDAGGHILAKETKSKKGIIGLQPKGSHNMVTHHGSLTYCGDKRENVRAPGPR